MLVQELVDILKEYNPNAEITLTYSEDIVISFIDCDGCYTKSNTPFVFIEPVDNYLRD